MLAVPSGPAVDRLGERRVALAGSVLLVAAGLGFAPLAGSVVGLVLASMALGTAHLCAVVAQHGQVLIPGAAGALAAGTGAAGVLACTALGLAGAAVAATRLHRRSG